MEKIKPSNWLLEQIKIKGRLLDIVNNCLDEEGFMKLVATIEKRHRELYQEGKTAAEILQDQELNVLKAKFEETALYVKSLPELRYGLEQLGFSEEYVNDTLAHENAHANAADALGSNHMSYIIGIYKDKEGNLRAPVAAETRIFSEQGFTDRQRAEISLQIKEAPKFYGNTLSPIDEKEAEELRKYLKEN